MTEEAAGLEPEGEVAPVSAEETKQPETQEPESSEQVEPEGEPEKPKPKLKGVGKRLHQLTSERDYWRQMAQQAQPVEPEKPEEPLRTLADFGHDESKFSAYLFERAEAKAVKAARTEASTWAKQQEAAARKESFESSLAEFADDHPDFYDGWRETPISQPMAEAIMDSEISAHVAYYLKNNQDVALKLFQLSGPAAAKEIGRIEERLVTEQAKAKAKPVSQAPSPPPKIEGSDPGNVERDPSKMTDEQYRKWREQTIARRSGYR